MPTIDTLVRGVITSSRGRATEYDAHRRVLVWYRSPRDNKGNLVLRPNTHERIDNKIKPISIVESRDNTSGWWNGQIPDGGFIPSSVRSAAYNQAYARLRKKLYVGSASLGVTLAGYMQSKEMILNRYNQLNQRADRVLAGLLTGVTPKKVASTHLEVIFGWAPLVTDIAATCTTLLPESIPPQYVTGRANYAHLDDIKRQLLSSPPITQRVKVTAKGRVTLSAQVAIENPNLWLMERAGLLNLGAVAWDLVPWSFVVNMFVNTGQIVNQMTDFTGLTLSGVTRTYNDKILLEVQQLKQGSYWYPGTEDVNFNVLQTPKVRTSHASPPLVNLQFKLPGVDAGLIAMSASLFTQKFSAVSGFISPFLKKK